MINEVIECPGSCPLCGSKLVFSTFDITHPLRGENSAYATLFCTNRLCLAEVKARGIYTGALRDNMNKAWLAAFERARENIGGFQFVD